MRIPSLSYLSDRFYISQPRVRERVTKAIYGAKNQTIHLFNKSVIVNSLRENGYLRAARLSRHSSLLRDEALVFSRLSHFIKPNMTFVDAGANIGIFSIMMADFQKIVENFRIVAFEVHPDTYSRLVLNANAHGFTANNIGLSSTESTRTFVEGAVSHVTRLLEDTNRYIIKDRSFSASLRRLDSFGISGDIILKVDVEGHEFDVLQGADTYFAAGAVKAVFIDGFRNDQRVPEFLKRHGFELRDCVTMDIATDQTFSLIAIKV